MFDDVHGTPWLKTKAQNVFWVDLQWNKRPAIMRVHWKNVQDSCTYSFAVSFFSLQAVKSKFTLYALFPRRTSTRTGCHACVSPPTHRTPSLCRVAGTALSRLVSSILYLKQNRLDLYVLSLLGQEKNSCCFPVTRPTLILTPDPTILFFHISTQKNASTGKNKNYNLLPKYHGGNRYFPWYTPACGLNKHCHSKRIGSCVRLAVLKNTISK
jgi:hypothetical protein